MQNIEGVPTRATVPLTTKLILVVLGAVIGFYGSVFGPFYIGVLGIILAVVGVIGWVRNTRWGRVSLMLGIGIIVGATLYVTVGVLTPDGDPSQSGCFNSSDEPCGSLAP